MITYQTEGVDMPDIQKRETTAWIKAVAASYGKKIGEIAYIFCSDEKILEVNRQYLQHDYYTDIITFDYCEGNRLSGDLFISLDRRPVCRRRLPPRTAPCHHPRHSPPLRHQRQGTWRTGDYGGGGEQSAGVNNYLNPGTGGRIVGPPSDRPPR